MAVGDYIMFTLREHDMAKYIVINLCISKIFTTFAADYE